MFRNKNPLVKFRDTSFDSAYDYVTDGDNIPELGAQEGRGDETTMYVKLFTPDGNWTWFITEYDPMTQVCFGLVDGHEQGCRQMVTGKRWGYFNLNELADVRGQFGLHIERDLLFSPRPVKKVKRT